MNCGDKIYGDGVYAKSGVTSEGAARLADGETVGASDLLEMEDGPYYTLDCALDD